MNHGNLLYKELGVAEARKEFVSWVCRYEDYSTPQ
jgi:hypothetical protein